MKRLSTQLLKTSTRRAGALGQTRTFVTKFQQQLVDAAAAGNLQLVKKLVGKTKIVDYSYGTALHLAAEKGNLEVVKFLAECMPQNPIIEQVLAIVTEKGVFEQSVIYAETYRWFNQLGMDAEYFRHFNAEQIANHIHTFIAAKKVSLSTVGVDDQIFFVNESADRASYLCPATKDAMNSIERKIEKYIKATPKEKRYSLYSYYSQGTITPSSNNRLALYVVKRYNADQEKNLESFQSKKEATVKRYNTVIEKANNQLKPVLFKDEPLEDGTTPVMIAIQNSADRIFLNKFTEIIQSIPNLTCESKFIETVDNGLVVYSMYLKSERTHDIDEFLASASLVATIPHTEFDQLLVDRVFTAQQVMYAYSASQFTFYFAPQFSEEFKLLSEHLKNDSTNLGRLNRLQVRMKNDALTMHRIGQAVYNNIDIAKELYNDFADIVSGKSEPFLNDALTKKIANNVQDPLDKQILQSFATFNSAVLKSNFVAKDKVAVGYRLDTKKFLGPNTAYPDVPHGIFLILGNDFTGFHVRFTDVARGGIRVIKSRSKQVWRTNAESLFTENYNLAWTQEKKNKDIPEGGSKGTVLLAPEYQSNVKVCFKKYVETLLDLLLKSEGVVDHLKQEEILYLGPDENSADCMDWAALYSKTRGYKYWKAFTTGKSPTIGGIPHDTYGMTTNSVHECALGIYRKLGLKEEEVTKVQTGGPDGDLGSNEILISKDITKAVVDGSGVIFDPNGLNREELNRLVKKRSMIENWDESKFGKGGFKVLLGDRNKTLPHGEVVENGEVFRNNFHLHPLFSADIFVPCGGRPQAINISNVKYLLKDDGTPKIKYISEGANLFITPDARLVLEKAGVVVIKDATANKGGVTSSSLEVLAALAMSDAEFEQHMQEKNGVLPEFYKNYVDEILQKIRDNARLEFECVWEENKRTGLPRPVITDLLSNKINTINYQTQASNLWDDMQLRNNIMKEALPKTLQQKIGYNNIMERVPENYLKATFASYLASRFIYTYGINASEFNFLDFITQYSKH